MVYPIVRPQPPPRARLATLGWLLLGAPILLLPIGGLAVMGDSFPLACVGVATGDDGLRIISAACAGERVTEVELRRVVGDERRSNDPVLWRIKSDATMPAEIVVGQVPPGMVETTALVEPVSSNDRLALFVTTNQVRPSWPLEFSMRDIPSGGVLAESAAVDDVDELRAEVHSNAPCGDPRHDDVKQRSSRATPPSPGVCRSWA